VNLRKSPAAGRQQAASPEAVISTAWPSLAAGTGLKIAFVAQKADKIEKNRQEARLSGDYFHGCEG